MGFTLPPRMNNTPSAAHARDLMARKHAIEEEMEAQFSILQSNGVNMDTPLIDPDGFPRADIDIWAVRHVRVKIIELRNDRNALMNDIGLALQNVYEPATVAREAPPNAAALGIVSEPFAKVDGVAPGSPAASAVRPFRLFLPFYSPEMVISPAGIAARGSRSIVWTSHQGIIHVFVVATIGRTSGVP